MTTLSVFAPRKLGASTLVIALAIVLAACSREPAATDIDQLIRADAAKLKGVEIHEVRKIGCAQAQVAPGYMCDVEVDASMPKFSFSNPPPMERSKVTRTLRFYQDGGSWKVSVN